MVPGQVVEVAAEGAECEEVVAGEELEQLLQVARVLARGPPRRGQQRGVQRVGEHGLHQTPEIHLQRTTVWSWRGSCDGHTVTCVKSLQTMFGWWV